MKIPYAIQGFFFAPVLIALIFLLKVTCPVGAGQGCFADNFLLPVFMPLKALYIVFSGHEALLARQEPLFILAYWALVGLIIGLAVDIYKKETRD